MMHNTGNRQRLLFGCWLLAALLLIGLNSYKLLSLNHQPLSKQSRTIKVLRSKLNQLESILADKASFLSDQVNVHAFFTRYRKQGKSGIAKAQPSMPAKSQNAKLNQIILPDLSGVIKTMDQSGALHFKAVLDGQVCSQKDQIRGFLVGKISPKGVVLHRLKQRWFIESPKPYYSSDQGE